jgi:hypothetical protein
MKALAALPLAAMLFTATIARCQAGPQQAPTVLINKGTLLRLEMLAALDTASARPGDDVPLRLTRALYAGGVTLLPEGTLLHGVVTGVTQPSGRCAAGEVRWKIRQISFADGSTARTRIWRKSPRSDEHVATEKPKPEPRSSADRAGLAMRDVAGAPIFAIAAVKIGTVHLLKKPFSAGACSRFTQDRPLPAHSTVALEIVEEHPVRY